jgi:hypothetical protein
MPSVEEAMRRSMGTGALESIARTVRRGLGERDVISDVTQGASDFKTAISSWDNCMATTFCKWPLIAIIIVGGLIIGSILWCIIRRICCGLSCCCSCFSCFKCCGNCMGCCDPPRRKKGYMEDDSYRQTNSHDGYNYGYKPQPAMVPVVVVPQGGGSQSNSSQPQYAQFAEFDVKRSGGGGGGGEDSLPAMPSWDDANSKKIMVEEEVEMEPLKKPEPSPPLPTPTPTLQNQNLALAAGGASGRGTPVSRGQSPVGPYGRPLDRVPTAGSSFGPPSSVSANGFAPPQRANTYADPYNNPTTTNNNNSHPYGYNNGNNGQYASSMSTGITDAYPTRSNSAAAYSQPPYGHQDRGYGNDAMYGGGVGGGQHSGNDYPYSQAPQQPQHQQQGYGHGHGYQQDYGQDQQQYGNQGYGSQGYGDQGYGNQGYNDHAYARQPSPAFSAGGGGGGGGGRSLMDAHQFSAQAPAPAPTSSSPRLQYVDMPAAPPLEQFSSSGPGSPRLVNNAGFDFNSGFSRPQTPRGAIPSPMGSLAQTASGPTRQLTYGNTGQHAAGNGYNSYGGGGGGGNHDELHGA